MSKSKMPADHSECSERFVVALSELHVQQGSSLKTVFLQTKLTNGGREGMGLVLTDGEDVWTGQLSENDLDKLSDRLKMDFDKFVTQTVSALTRQKLADVTFEYQLTALPSDRMQLVWKKCVPEEDIKFQLGQVTLTRVQTPSQALCGLLTQCVSTTSSLRAHIEDLEADNARLTRDRTNALKRLEKCVAAKTEVEKDLFSKFVAILNSKKEKIRELEEERQHGECDITQPSTNRLQQLVEAVETTIQQQEDSEPPASKKSKPTLSADNSISFWSEEDGEGEDKPQTHNMKRKAVTKKAPVSKPVLPRVSSNPTPEDNRTSRRTSLLKSGSASSKSSDNTDDLIDML